MDAPQWVRDAQAERYLCTCGKPAISIWAGTRRPICAECLEIKQSNLPHA
jgi:hypothetical protein